MCPDNRNVFFALSDLKPSLLASSDDKRECRDFSIRVKPYQIYIPFIFTMFSLLIMLLAFFMIFYDIYTKSYIKNLELFVPNTKFNYPF